ncbi:MAG: hypothetical protein ACRCSG_03890 [Cellulosilyticaceae bacterium]
MLFNYLLYPHLKEKEKHLQKIEAQIFALFDNYYFSWNKLCDLIGPPNTIPKLTLSIRNFSIYQCIAEMEHAAIIFYQSITALALNAGASELFSLPYRHFSTIHMLDVELVRFISTMLSLSGDALAAMATFNAFRAFYLSGVLHSTSLPPAVAANYRRAIDSSFSSSKTAAPFVNLSKQTEISLPLSSLGTLDMCTTIVSTAFVVLLVDFIFSAIDGLVSNISISNNIKQLEYVLSELSETMIKETLKIQTLSQSLIDGVIWIDNSNVILLSKNPNDDESNRHSFTSTLVSIDEIATV